MHDIEKVYELINQADLNTTRDIIHFLPFWENGVRFFTIEGPNKEKIEFSQYLWFPSGNINYPSVNQNAITLGVSGVMAFWNCTFSTGNRSLVKKCEYFSEFGTWIRVFLISKGFSIPSCSRTMSISLASLSR